VVQNVSGLAGVGIEEHLDAKLPLDAAFKDENGKDVKLGDYFDGKHPVILNLIYFNCPMLCSLVVNGMVDGLKELDWGAGQEFNIVTVSFNPLETPALAKLKQQNYLKYYARPSAEAGWHFLTGPQDSITRLTQTIGFDYKWDAQRQQFAHAAAIYMISP
jgi:protein SCO1/2